MEYIKEYKIPILTYIITFYTSIVFIKPLIDNHNLTKYSHILTIVLTILFKLLVTWIFNYIKNLKDDTKDAKIKLEQFYNKIKEYEETNNKLLFIVDEDIKYITSDNKDLDKLIITLDSDTDDDFFNWINNNYYQDDNNNIDIDIVIHTNGGSISSSDIINIILRERDNVNIYIPYYAFSAGFVVALSGKIHMNDYSLVGPIDPQCVYKVSDDTVYSCSSKNYEKLLNNKDKEHIKDEMLLKIYNNKALHTDNINTVIKSLEKRNYNKVTIDCIIDKFCSGDYPHHKPFLRSDLEKLGLKIHDIPDNINELFKEFIELKKIDQ